MSGVGEASTSDSKQPLVPPRNGIAGAASCVAVMSSFLYGYSICVLNSCMDLIPVVFQWCGNDWQSNCLASRACQGLINASLYLGAAIGAFLAGRPRFTSGGSRFTLLVSDVMFMVGGLFCAFAQDFVALFLGRLISGLGLGVIAMTAPLYIAEISPRERRGANTAMHGILITVGILCSITFGIPQSPPPSGPEEPLEGLNSWYWRLLVGFPVLPALMQFILFSSVMPLDPPSYLVLKGRTSEARKLLYRTYGLTAPEAGVAASLNNPAASLELQLTELREATANFAATPRIYIYQALFDPFLRCALFVGFMLAAFEQLSGINALMSYSNSLFQDAGIPPEHLTLASTTMATANVIVSVLTAKVVDNWGRRKLLLLGPCMQAVAMAIISFGTSGLPTKVVGLITVACFSLFVVSFSAGLGAVTWLYLAEIYPMEIRGSALSTCGVINWLSCFSVVFGARFLSCEAACRLFGAISFVGLLGVYFWVIETKGCDLNDSPMTPKSARSSSKLLTPNSGGKGSDAEDDEDDDEDEEDAPQQQTRR